MFFARATLRQNAASMRRAVIGSNLASNLKHNPSLAKLRPGLSCRYNTTLPSTDVPAGANGASGAGGASSKAAAEANETLLEEMHEFERSGTITKGPGEILLYYSEVSIPSARLFKYIPAFLYKTSSKAILRQIEERLPKDLPLKVVDFVPRAREGGAFVKIKLEDPTITTRNATKEIVKYVAEHRPWAPLKQWQWRVFPVLGRPWIEDLFTGLASTIRVTFEGPDVSPEQLYEVLRRYGRIQSIDPPPPGTKDSPRSTVVQFERFSDAAAARYCANSIVIDGTKIHISFVVQPRKNVVSDWFVNHPRIAVPIFVALLAGAAYLIFEPIRLFSVGAKIQGTLDIDQYPLFRQAKETAHDWWNYLWSVGEKCITGVGDEKVASTTGDWDELVQPTEELERLLKEGTNTFIIVTGPKGSGKSRVVQTAIGNDANTLTIDCDKLAKTKTDNDMLSALSHMLGYWPVFLWTNNISRFIDIATQSLSGQSSGFSETLEQQEQRMLNTTAAAIHNVALKNKPADVSESDYLNRHPEARPVVIVRGFSGSKCPAIQRLVADWAGSLVQSNTAQVIFVSNDVCNDKTLSEALPNHVFKTIDVEDASADSAKQYIINYCKSFSQTGRQAEMSGEAKQAVTALSKMPAAKLAPLGGRLTDLQAFARRLLSGEMPQEAMQQMIHATALEISQMFLTSGNAVEWTPEQAWTIVRGQAKQPSAKAWYPVLTELGSHPLFATDEQLKALVPLEYRELISVRTIGGRIVGIRAGKPLYYAAFKELVDDPTLSAMMDCRVIKTYAKLEEAKITKVEAELQTLASQPKRWEVQARQDYLAKKLYASQMKILDLEKQLAQRQKQVDSSYPSSNFL